MVARAELGDTLDNYPCLLGDGGYRGIPNIETPQRGSDGRIIKDHAWRRHRRIRTEVEHVIARLKDWQCLRQFRRRGSDTINQTLQAIAGLWNLKRGQLRVNS